MSKNSKMRFAFLEIKKETESGTKLKILDDYNLISVSKLEELIVSNNTMRNRRFLQNKKIDFVLKKLKIKY